MTARYVYAAGETTKTVAVTIANDTTFEQDETYFVNLTNGVNAIIADTQGVGTIQNDDAQPSVAFTAASQTASEGAGTAKVTSSLSNGSYQDVTVPDLGRRSGVMAAAERRLPAKKSAKALGQGQMVEVLRSPERPRERVSGRLRQSAARLWPGRDAGLPPARGLHGTAMAGPVPRRGSSEGKAHSRKLHP